MTEYFSHSHFQLSQKFRQLKDEVSNSSFAELFYSFPSFIPSQRLHKSYQSNNL